MVFVHQHLIAHPHFLYAHQMPAQVVHKTLIVLLIALHLIVILEPGHVKVNQAQHVHLLVQHLFLYVILVFVEAVHMIPTVLLSALHLFVILEPELVKATIIVTFCGFHLLVIFTVSH